jgi:AcrR family transcriptional regulator
MPRTARLSRDDWAAAALAALAEGGVTAVAVEPVAARLGASKSSFYWLFADRRALLDAALERWERLQTSVVIEQLALIKDPAARLRHLMRHSFSSGTGAGGAGSDLALRLITEPADAAVREVTERVTRRRLAVITSGFTEMGHPPERARQLATASYAMYLGTAALNRINTGPADVAAYVDAIMGSFG